MFLVKKLKIVTSIGFLVIKTKFIYSHIIQSYLVLCFLLTFFLILNPMPTLKYIVLSFVGYTLRGVFIVTYSDHDQETLSFLPITGLIKI